MGTFTIRCDDGQVDTVPVLHGFPSGYYSILQGGLTYRMPVEDFWKLLKDGGVDVSKFPD